MSIQSKFFKLNPNILVEYIYNNENMYAENYHVITDLNISKKLFVPNSTITKSKLSTNLLLIDPVLNRFTTYDPSFNFYQKQDYFTAPVPHDTIRIYLPVGFNFLDNGYTGLHLKVYSLNYDNKKNMVVSSYFFDDQDTKRQTEVSLGNSFLYDEKQWGKYIQYDIPSPYYISKQRITTTTQNYPDPYTINANLDSLGMNENTPIFFDFSFIVGTTTTFGVKYYNLGDLYRTSIGKIPEYQNLAVQIVESTNGDYFEIYGTYGNSNENLDDFVAELRAKGQQIKIDYIVTLYEENILQSTQTFEIQENFSQKVNYRPIIMFSNTTAAINVEMKITDLVNMSSFSRLASLGLTKNLFKYGRNLTRIELSTAYKPKLYNSKPSTVTMQGGLNSSAVIDVTKVNYPLLVDKFKIVVGANNSTTTTEYKGTGVLKVVFTPFDNIIKFYIAKQITANGTVEQLNLADLLVNAELTMIFKSDDQFLEKNIFHESGDNDLSHGIVIFKITESDVVTLKTIQKSNSNFFLTIKAKNTNVRTQLYSGTFIFYDALTFKDIPVSANIITTDSTTPNMSATPTINEGSLTSLSFTTNNTYGATSSYDPTSYRNIMVYIKTSANPTDFEAFLTLKNITNNIYIKYNFSYFILAIPKAIITEIQKHKSVEKVVEMTFELGKNKVPTLSPKERRIAELESLIRNDESAMQIMQQRASKQNTTIDVQIKLEATSLYEKEQVANSKKNPVTDSQINQAGSTQSKLDLAQARINQLEAEVHQLQLKLANSTNPTTRAQALDSIVNQNTLSQPITITAPAPTLTATGNTTTTTPPPPPPSPPKKYAKVLSTMRAKASPTSNNNTGLELKPDTLYLIVQTKMPSSTNPSAGVWYQINTNNSGGTQLGWISEDDISEIIEA